MFQLSAEQFANLRSQFVTSNVGRGGRRYAPYAFTEQGVAMLSSVLNSQRATGRVVAFVGGELAAVTPKPTPPSRQGSTAWANAGSQVGHANFLIFRLPVMDSKCTDCLQMKLSRSSL